MRCRQDKGARFEIKARQPAQPRLLAVGYELKACCACRQIGEIGWRMSGSAVRSFWLSDVWYFPAWKRIGLEKSPSWEA